MRISSQPFENLLRVLIERGPARIEVFSHAIILQPGRVAPRIFLLGGGLDFGSGFQERPFGDAFLDRVVLLEKSLLHGLRAALPAKVYLNGQARDEALGDAAGFQGGVIFEAEGGGADPFGLGQFLGLGLVEEGMALAALPWRVGRRGRGGVRHRSVRVVFSFSFRRGL